MYNFESNALKYSKIITKEFVLDNISQEQIFSLYLSHTDIKVLKKQYTNTLRDDKNSDCSYIYINNTLYFRDFALGESYNCFDLLVKYYNLSFIEAVSKIANDFNLINLNTNYNSNLKKTEYSIYEKKICKIQVKEINWNKQNKQYWNQYYFKDSTLDKLRIKPISHYWVNDDMFIPKQSYSYYHGFDIEHRRTILNLNSDKKYKWIKNLDDTTIQGYNLLPKTGDLLIITKSYKDIGIYLEEGISSISSNAEGISIRLDKIKELKERFKRIILQIDSDTQEALNNSIKLSNFYEIPAIYFPEKLNKKCKDISGIRKSEGVNNTQQLIKQLFNL